MIGAHPPGGRVVLGCRGSQWTQYYPVPYISSWPDQGPAMMMTGRVRAGFNESPAKAIVVWLAVLILYLLTAPVAAEAQQPGKIYRIGYLQTSTRQEQLHMVKAFEDGLRDLGYRVGQNVVIEYRFAEARPERLPGLAADLVRLNVDVIVTGINSNTAAAMKATTTIPIVMANSVDPVGAGFVETLARTGICLDLEEAPGWACRDVGCGLVYVSKSDCQHGHQESAAGDFYGARIR